MAGNETVGLVEILFLYVEVFLDPLHLAHAPYAIIEDTAQYVANGTIDHQYPGIEPRGHQSQQHGFAGEGTETASQESCQEHSPIAVLGEKTYYEIHRFMLVRNKVTAASTKKRIFVRRELVRAMKWPMIGLTEIIMMWKVR